MKPPNDIGWPGRLLPPVVLLPPLLIVTVFVVGVDVAPGPLALLPLVPADGDVALGVVFFRCVALFGGDAGGCSSSEPIKCICHKRFLVMSEIAINS